jgi:alpha-beta hydrolase superfamily lysophospholipase
MDFNIKLRNGQVLRGMIQSPGENLKAIVILVHGIGEHIHRYEHWAALFNKESIGFAGVDLPGQGRSDGNRGDIKSYSLLEEMIDMLIDNCNKTFPGCPVYLYGHSLGGGIVLDYLLRRNPDIKGAIVTSPYLRLAFDPPKIKLIMASAMKHLLPGLIQPTGLNADYLSHDKDVVVKYKNDPLVHGKISVRLFCESLASARYSLDHASELKTPVLLLHGSKDMITSPEGSREFAGKTKMVELKIWEGGYHELHNEPFKDEVFRYIMDWIKDKMILLNGTQDHISH